MAAHQCMSPIGRFCGLGLLGGCVARDGVFPVSVHHSITQSGVSQLERFAVESPRMVCVPKDTDRRRRDHVHRFCNKIRLRIVSMGFDDHLQLQGGCIISQLVKAVGYLPGSSLSTGLLTDNVAEDADKSGIEFGCQVQVRSPDNGLALAFGGVS